MSQDSARSLAEARKDGVGQVEGDLSYANEYEGGQAAGLPAAQLPDLAHRARTARGRLGRGALAVCGASETTAALDCGQGIHSEQESDTLTLRRRVTPLADGRSFRMVMSRKSDLDSSCSIAIV